MTNINSNAVQHGLERKNTGILQSLWVELAGYCNLACSYCYANGGKPQNPTKIMPWNILLSILKQAQILGVDSIGIPGAGEPLLPRNLKTAMSFITEATKRRMFVTLFTTGEFLTERLAKELLTLPVEIMLKCNSIKPSLQDKFVSDTTRGRNISGYGTKRNQAMEMLISIGFNKEKFGRKSRMALVTSIMTSDDGDISNYDEISSILRYCRKNNIIFDCDSVLKRGRGTSCTLCTADKELKQKLLELQKIDHDEFGINWELSQSYVGTVCDRYMHHMYINQYGEIRPCIGATKVNLGNINDTSLAKAWDSREMQIIRLRKYGGTCGNNCANFAEKKCNSCLGRRAINLNNEFLRREKLVDTIGCWNFRQK